MKAVAFIPARSGSERVKDKNIKLLNGHPLVAYSVVSAIRSECFSCVYIVTDSDVYARAASHYGASCIALRPPETAGSDSPDLSWLTWILVDCGFDFSGIDAFAILRPTSPFRRSQTIRQAMEVFVDSGADSIRAVSKVTEHPGKMWCTVGNHITPLLPFEINGVPWHSNQTKILPEVFVQNASLEISKVSNVTESRSISGSIVAPFFSGRVESIDINTPEDWIEVEEFARANPAALEPIDIESWFKIDI